MAGIEHVRQPYHYNEGRDMTPEDFGTACAQAIEDKILEVGPENVAAFIGEPVQGAGGVIIPPANYWPQVEAICRKYGILLVCDEVICGFGRTGNIWGHETMGIQPDIIAMAKGLSSGYLPISAVAVSADIIKVMKTGGDFVHGYTYSGHPVCAAVGLKTLEIYERDQIFQRAAALAPKFQSRLRSFLDHPLVGEARGVGMIGALEFVSNKATKAGFTPYGSIGTYCFERCHVHGLIPRNVGDGIALCPPLIITEAQIDEMFDKLSLALDDTLDHVTRSGLLAA
jgi:putrescine aminotransferase